MSPIPDQEVSHERSASKHGQISIYAGGFPRDEEQGGPFIGKRCGAARTRMRS